MAGRRLSIKQSYAFIYQRLFSQEDHTFDPKKEDWSCNKNKFFFNSCSNPISCANVFLVMIYVSN